MCEVCSKLYPYTQHRSICVTVNPFLVSRPTAFRRRFNLRKENWGAYAIDVDILIEEIGPPPEKNKRFVEAIRVTSRKHIPRGVEATTFPVYLKIEEPMRHTRNST